MCDQSLGGEDPPGGETANPLWYSCLANLVDLESYSPWGHKEPDMTEHAHVHEPVKDYISC